jgi:two-component system response regulator YesN
MWRVILIDDEEYVRAELAALFPWKHYQFDLIGEAENAKAAMTLIAETKPDLAITDIRMPEMDGLELISWLGGHHPQLVVAVVSADNDFPYVREALRSGAADYLIKSEATLETAGAFLERIGGILDRRQSIWRQPEKLTVSLARYYRLATESLWRDLLTGACDEAEITLRGRRLGIVLESLWFGLIFLHVAAVRQDNPRTFREALAAKVGAIWDWNWEWDLIDFNRGDFLILAYQVAVTPDLKALEKLQAITGQLVQDCPETMTARVSVRVCSFHDLPGNFREVNVRYPQSPMADGLSSVALTVRKALGYIQLNFTRDLSLGEVAGHVGVSKSYLSRVFPEYAGEHFNACLQRLRLERAKELLRFTDAHIYEIAPKVGFWNSRYFSKVFQNAEGLTPADYRRAYRN